MSYNPRQRRLEYAASIGRSFGMALSLEKWRVLRDIISTCILGYLAYLGIAPEISVMFIGVINTITVSELYKAIKTIQAQNRKELQE